MAAKTSEEAQKVRRRKRLVRGLLVGGAAIGLPALANALIRRRVSALEAPEWGRIHRYAWKHGEIAFQKVGAGPALLLLHSFGSGHNSEEWSQAGRILGRRYRVYVPDLLGWGRSDKPPIAYDGEIYIQLIRDFLTDVVGSCTLVAAAGLSAAYALQVAVDEPELMRGLALVVPVGIDLHGDEPDLKDAVIHRLLRLPILGTSAMNLYTSRTGIGHHLRNEVYAAPERVDAALLEHYYRASHAPGGFAPLAGYLSGYLNHPVEEVLPRVSQAVWIGWGRQASSPAVESADLWLRALPHAELEVFEGSGILPHAEVPNRFCRKLQVFLTRLTD